MCIRDRCKDTGNAAGKDNALIPADLCQALLAVLHGQGKAIVKFSIFIALQFHMGRLFKQHRIDGFKDIRIRFWLVYIYIVGTEDYGEQKAQHGRQDKRHDLLKAFPRFQRLHQIDVYKRQSLAHSKFTVIPVRFINSSNMGVDSL